MSVFETILAPALEPIQPEPVRGMIGTKLDSYLVLVLQNNKLVASINEAKQQDPNSTEYQDAVWKRVVVEESDPEIVAAEKRYQKAQAAVEKELKLLREKAAKHMTPPMSEDDVAKAKKTVNEGKAAIQEAASGAKAIAEMADQMLALVEKPVENGVFSLLPEPDSLMNTRGRKSGGTVDRSEGYATRIVDAKIDGQAANKTTKVKGVPTVKAHFNYIAEHLSRRFDDKQFPENLVTALEIEEAYYDSKNATFRESAAMPEVHEFTWTKEVRVANTNDDAAKTVPVTVKIEVTKWTAPAADEKQDDAGENVSADSAPENGENATPEKADDGNAESAAA